MTSTRSRLVGAVAGLGPATLILGYYLGTGGPAQPGLVTFIVSPVIAGWLIGPQLDGTKRATVFGAAAYTIVAYLVHSAFGVVGTSLDDVHDVLEFLPALLEGLGIRATVTVIYFPFWTVVLSPLALVWVVTARLLHVPLRRLGGSADSGRRASRHRRPSHLLWASAAALLGYTLGFMVVAPSQCVTTQTVSSEASVTPSDTTVCTSVIGITYSGHGTFDPPREPAIVVGLVVAAIAFAIVLVALHVKRQAGRPRRSQSDLE
jgi:hypothetical protein